ncbi:MULTISPECIES: glycosyltransferase family 2 protein [unclassified Paenibacillus]|uniref:glycosyltransferase family 2 protein n=1 Tax=unclassified Paenibacillus TaxID=185978 RepID=UPI0036952808
MDSVTSVLGSPGSYPISAVIIAQDDETRISKAILSCRLFADEVVVIDGGSKDGTVGLAESLNCRVFVNPWPGYAKQREFGVERAVHDWVFLIDTDEVVSDELAADILERKPGLSDPGVAYSLYRIGDFLGRWLDRGERLVRLYNRTQYGIRNSLVHEMPDVSEKDTVRLQGTLWHQGFRSINDHVARFNKYTDLEAQSAHDSGKPFRISHLLLRPPARFLQKYFIHGLFRKGMAGFAVSVFWVMYEFMVAFKHYELKSAKKLAKHNELAHNQTLAEVQAQIQAQTQAEKDKKGERSYAVQ